MGLLEIALGAAAATAATAYVYRLRRIQAAKRDFQALMYAAASSPVDAHTIDPDGSNMSVEEQYIRARAQIMVGARQYTAGSRNPEDLRGELTAALSEFKSDGDQWSFLRRKMADVTRYDLTFSAGDCQLAEDYQTADAIKFRHFPYQRGAHYYGNNTSAIDATFYNRDPMCDTPPVLLAHVDSTDVNDTFKAVQQCVRSESPWCLSILIGRARSSFVRRLP
jgi:hypothetical protein